MKKQAETKIQAIGSAPDHNEKLRNIMGRLFVVSGHVSFLCRAFSREDDEPILLTPSDSRGLVLMLEDIKSQVNTLADELDEESTGDAVGSAIRGHPVKR
jgi:hypothetical protein